MKIVNGRWVDEDDFDSPVTDFNFHKLKSVGEKVSAVFGKEITHDRIEIMTKVAKLNKKQSQNLAEVLMDSRVSKIIGV